MKYSFRCSFSSNKAVSVPLRAPCHLRRLHHSIFRDEKRGLGRPRSHKVVHANELNTLQSWISKPGLVYLDMQHSAAIQQFDLNTKSYFELLAENR